MLVELEGAEPSDDRDVAAAVLRLCLHPVVAIVLCASPTSSHAVQYLRAQEDILQLNGLGTSSTFDLTAVGSKWPS